MFWSKSDENYTVQKVAADIQCTYIRLMYSFYGFIFLAQDTQKRIEKIIKSFKQVIYSKSGMCLPALLRWEKNQVI